MVGKSRHKPIRTCIVCRQQRYKKQMTRLCVSGALVMVDEKQTMPGRGAYACPDSSCLERALDNYRGCLNRAFKTGNL